MYEYIIRLCDYDQKLPGAYCSTYFNIDEYVKRSFIWTITRPSLRVF